MLYFDYSKSTNILKCPTDLARGKPATEAGTGADNALRSYIMNGWDELFGFSSSRSGDMKETLLAHPSETIVFGEKQHDQPDFWMDFLEGADNITDKIQHGMHGSNSQPAKTGGHNNACGDCSVQYKTFSRDISPVDWWFIFDTNRSSPNYTTQLLPLIKP